MTISRYILGVLGWAWSSLRAAALAVVAAFATIVAIHIPATANILPIASIEISQAKPEYLESYNTHGLSFMEVWRRC